MPAEEQKNTTRQSMDSFFSRLRCRLFYRVRVKGADHIPRVHGALLVSNHVSVADPILIRRAILRTLGKKAAGDLEFVRPHKDDESFNETVENARKHIADGKLICLFAEGRLERIGKLLRFTRALESIVDGQKLPIVPVAIDRPWGILVRRHEGSVRWKWPRRFPYQVTVCFGESMAPSSSAFRVRRMVQELQARFFERRKRRGETLPAKFVRTARRFPFRLAMTDHTGKKIRFLTALAAALVLRKILARRLDDNPYVGVLLPPSNAAALINAALALLGKIAVNLNYTSPDEAFDRCVEKAQIHTIITSKLFVRKLEMKSRDEFLFAEDLRGDAGFLDRLSAFAQATLLPAALLCRLYCAVDDPSAPAAVLFSSGSTGDPKGVVLSHFNVLSNIQAVSQMIHLEGDDRVVGVLPLFHSFGFTITMWLPFVLGQGVLYHPDPRDGKAVGRLVRDEGGTLLVGPPTFVQIWMRQVQGSDFKGLRYALTGAEKLKATLARAFRAKYGIPLLEGYGATEVSPVVSINTFDVVEGQQIEVGHKEGSLGHPLPGVTVKVIDLDSGQELDANQEGMLCVKGPNVMIGYLNDPDLSAEVLVDGWYITGDVGKLDEDGFVQITDRLSRFSKIGGEMVPHVKIESELQEIAPDARFGVTSVPDDLKGERLVVVHANLDRSWTPTILCEALRKRGLPNLWIPRPTAFLAVGELPVLATGKTDLRALKEIAHHGGA